MPWQLDPRILDRLTASLEELNRHRPLPPRVVQKLRDQLVIEMTYHSNAIEGNRLTLKETLLVLREGITIKGKNLQEHLEAKNHEEAMNFLFDVVDAKQSLVLSHLLIRQLHQLVVKDSDASIAGSYRTTDVQIVGSTHRPPPGYQVQQRMSKLIDWMTTHESKQHPVEFAALAHHRFVAIHPFEDGNGRTGRLLMNLLLMRHGYPIAIVLKADRMKYYAALDAADGGDPSAIIRLIAQAVERTLNLYLQSVTRSSPKTELVLLSELAPQTEFSAKYLNLLARTGLLKAQKEGRNWYSSLAAVDDYRRSRRRRRYP